MIGSTVMVAPRGTINALLPSSHATTIAATVTVTSSTPTSVTVPARVSSLASHRVPPGRGSPPR